MAQITKENDGTAADVADVDDDEFDQILDDQLKARLIFFCVLAITSKVSIISTEHIESKDSPDYKL